MIFLSENAAFFNNLPQDALHLNSALLVLMRFNKHRGTKKDLEEM